jgi:hypothetical protein
MPFPLLVILLVVLAVVVVFAIFLVVRRWLLAEGLRRELPRRSVGWWNAHLPGACVATPESKDYTSVCQRRERP